MKTVSPIDDIGRKAPGSAMLSMGQPGSTTASAIGWFLREDSHKIGSLTQHSPLECRAATFSENNCIVASLLLLAGPLKPENLWETWIDVKEPESEAIFDILSRQSDLFIHFVGDTGMVELCLQGTNLLARFARKAIAGSKAMPPWPATLFDRQRERVCRRWPDKMSLWRSMVEMARKATSDQPGAEAVDKTIGMNLGSDVTSLHDSPEANYRGLHDDMRELLVCLAPFKGAIYRGAMDSLLACLKAQPPLARLALHRWDEMLGLAWKRGLLRPHPVDPTFSIFVPELAATLLRHLERFDQSEMRQVIDKAFYQTYYSGARTICQLFESNVPADEAKGRSLMYLEYENMRIAMEFGLANGAPIRVIYMAMSNYLIRTEHYQRGLELGESVMARQDRSCAAKTIDEVMERSVVMCGIADHQEMLGKHEAAEISYREGLGICFGYEGPAEPHIQGLLGAMYHKLGLLAYQQRDWESADSHLRKSLGIRIEMNDRVGQSETLGSLGRVATKVHDWPQARQAYKSAMNLFASLGNRLLQARTCSDLARAAAACGQSAEAKRYFRESLAFFTEFDDKANQGVVHHNLGDLAQDEMQYKRAWKEYRKAIRIFIEIGDRGSRVLTYNRLGVLMMEMGERNMARLFYRRALKLASMVENRFVEAMTYHELGNLARRSHRWDVAAEYFDKALEIYEAFDDLYRRVELGLDLGRLAYAQGRWIEGQDQLLAALRRSSGAHDSMPRERALKVIAQLWRKSGDAALPGRVAQVLETTSAEAELILRKRLESK